MGAECPCDRGSDPSPRGWASIAGRRRVAPRGGPLPPASMGSGPPAPPHRCAPGLLGGVDSGLSCGEALASGAPCTSICSDRTRVRSPGTFVTLHGCQTRAVGLVFPVAYGGRAEQSPPSTGSTGTAQLPCRQGAPPGTGGGLCHCLLTGTVSALVYKRRGEPRGWLGLGAGPDPSGSKPGLPGAVPGPGSPAAHAAHPAHGRSAWGEDFISAQRQQRRPTVSSGDRAGQGGPWYCPRPPLLPLPSPRCPGDSRWGWGGA